jgi:hypothetical protein
MLYDFSMNTTVNEGNAGDNLGKSGFLKIRWEMGKPAGEGGKTDRYYGPDYLGIMKPVGRSESWRIPGIRPLH